MDCVLPLHGSFLAGESDMSIQEDWPVGYRVQTGIACCATCKFGGYLDEKESKHRLCVCEVMGECGDSDYVTIAKEPLGICEAYKPAV